MLRRIVFCCLVPLWLAGSPAQAQAQDVDVELILAVDVSLSMDTEELRLQRQGYTEALRNPEVLRAIAGGLNRRIAVAYLEWAGWSSQTVVVPWTLIDGAVSANAVAQRIESAPIMRLRRTSISGAMMQSMRLFEQSPFRSLRKVIDISGDGPNNEGPVIAGVRQEALERGIVINGLPILIRRQQAGWFDIDQLDEYYADCVIGGPGAFMIPVQSVDQFIDAIRTKLVLEITGIEPEPRIIPASDSRVPCDVGEQIWNRFNNR
jgi:hypothetical protein